MFISGRRTMKREKMNKRKGRDRLSDLPDSVLIEILSLLKSREVAQTCILSKRWEKLWASVPCLDFDFADFLSEEEEERTEEGLQSDIKRFKNFVSRFLDLREDDKDIERFKLKCDVTDSETRTGILLSARMWIRYALNHKAKNLHVMLTAPLEKFYMPDCFFTCESLEEAYMDIKENRYSYKIRPDIVILPKLLALHFSSVTIKRDSMEKILVGCPVLESLGLFGCNLEMCNLSLRTLKSLTIIDSDFDNDPPNWYISAPNLEYLNIAEAINFPSKLKDMSNVTKAVIATLNVSGHYYRELLSSLSGVKDMKLCHESLEKISGELPNCPIFHNLKILTLGECCMCCNFRPIPSFLMHCPNLEHFILLHDSVDCEEYGFHDDEEDVPNVEQFERFECKNLQMIEVRYETWHHDVLLLERLLQHCTMEIDGVQIILTEDPDEP